MWIDGTVVEFRLSILWLLLRSPMVEITVYPSDETYKVETAVQCFVCHTECVPDFLVMVIQYIYIYIYNRADGTDSLEALSPSKPIALGMSSSQHPHRANEFWLCWSTNTSVSIYGNPQENVFSFLLLYVMFVLLGRFDCIATILCGAASRICTKPYVAFFYSSCLQAFR